MIYCQNHKQKELKRNEGYPQGTLAYLLPLVMSSSLANYYLKRNVTAIDIMQLRRQQLQQLQQMMMTIMTTVMMVSMMNRM
jgi:hypothetical protein